jgi:hypothetical protein
MPDIGLLDRISTTNLAEARLIIIEGVPGAGKTTLQESLREAVKGRYVTVFPEEALLFGWIHAWIPGIDELRLSLMHRIAGHVEELQADNPSHLFILNRFHLSYLIFADEPDMDSYDHLLERLRDLGARVLVPQIPTRFISTRSLHVERVDPLWREHLDRRLKKSGFGDIGAMYTDEQQRVRRLLVEQKLPYEILDWTSADLLPEVQT